MKYVSNPKRNGKTQNLCRKCNRGGVSRPKRNGKIIRKVGGVMDITSFKN